MIEQVIKMNYPSNSTEKMLISLLIIVIVVILVPAMMESMAKGLRKLKQWLKR